MKKKILFIILSVLIIVSLTACSAESKDTVGTTESTVTTASENTLSTAESTIEKETTTTETTTQKSESSDTTTRPAEQKSADQTTTKKVTATQKHTTTKRQSTTKKVTTTQKPTTTKKVTTTAAPYWCDEGGSHHIVDAGPIGWCNSFDEATDKALEYISEHGDSGNFRVKQCYGCGKYTATVTIH